MTPEILSPVDPSSAQALQEEIDELVSHISNNELRLAKSYARLGGKLREVKNTQAWIALGYERFSLYMDDIRKRIGRQRSQVYAILQVAETLLPYVSEEQLEAVGINKAQELRRLVAGGLRPDVEIQDPKDWMTTPEEVPDRVQLMDYAARREVTAQALRVKVNELLHVKEDPKGTWYDFGGGYLLADERKELEQFWSTGKRVLEISDEQPEHVWKTQVMLAAARECMSSWAAEYDEQTRQS